MNTETHPPDRPVSGPLVSGRLVIGVMAVLAIALLGGYDLIRRQATPNAAVLAEDRGSTEGTFDRVYEFDGLRYRIREGEKDPRSTGTMIVSRLDAAGAEDLTLTRDRDGTVEDALFLEIEKGAPPSIVVITRSAGTGSHAEGTIYTIEGDRWNARALEPLPDELRPRYTGHDAYEQQGAFLYRKVSMEPAEPGGEPIRMNFFYDFRNLRWVISD